MAAVVVVVVEHSFPDTFHTVVVLEESFDSCMGLEISKYGHRFKVYKTENIQRKFYSLVG